MNVTRTYPMFSYPFSHIKTYYNACHHLPYILPLSLLPRMLPLDCVYVSVCIYKYTGILLLIPINIVYVVPPQSWGDQSDTKHSKCLLLGGRQLNQNDFNPQTERKWRRTGCDGPSRPSK